MGDKWRDNSADPDGHNYVNSILTGKFFLRDRVAKMGEDGKEIPLTKPHTVAVKGYLPDSTTLSLYKSSLPFIMARVGRSVTKETIYIKSTKLDYASKIQQLEKDYCCYLDGVFFALIKTPEDFENFVTLKSRHVLDELVNLIQWTTVDYNELVRHPYSRTWWLKSNDFPSMYLPRKFGIVQNACSSSYSGAFSLLTSRAEDYDLPETKEEEVKSSHREEVRSNTTEDQEREMDKLFGPPKRTVRRDGDDTDEETDGREKQDGDSARYDKGKEREEEKGDYSSQDFRYVAKE